jgi:serine phosphatase RsbU (regulator of sigma subunit)
MNQQFNEVVVELNTGDGFYIFTDGFSDQFGGPKRNQGGKKLTTQKFREAIISTGNLSLLQQKEALSLYFDEWKGDLEQVDDVCIIGVRL